MPLRAEAIDANVWRVDPSILLGLAALVGAYTWGVIYLRRRSLWGKEITLRHVAFFSAGVAVLAVALISPIDHIGEKYLLSVHMAQHMLIMMVAPPLVLLGVPRWMMQWVIDFLRIGRVVKLLTGPVIAFIAFNGVLIAWHLPTLYEAALRDPIVHILEHIVFIGTGFLSWYCVVDPAGQHARLHPLAKIVYLFLFVIPSGILGAAFAFARQPIYAYYAAAPRLWNLTPLEDQAWAGGIMWVPGWTIYFTALSIVFAAWLRREEQAGTTPSPR